MGQLETPLSEEAISPLTHADVFATLARSYSALGRPERAVELLERCLAEVREKAPEDAAAEVRFATYLSYALADLRDLGAARNVVQQALSRAEGADPYSRIRLYWSLARLAPMEGSRGRHCGRSTARSGFSRRPRTRGSSRAHTSRAGRSCSTTATTRRPARISRAPSGSSATASTPPISAGCGRSRRALGRWPASTTTRRRSRPARWTCSRARIRSSFEQAVRLFAGESRWQEAATTSRAWAQTLRAAGRDQDALDVLDQAAEYAARVPLVTAR